MMADIIDSGKQDQLKLMLAFKQMTININEKFADSIASPLTVTLGDEFQGVIKNLEAAIDIIISIEEFIIRKKRNFKLRYILYEGQIETPLNRQIAYGMMGKGLTSARNLLEKAKSTDRRIQVQLTKISLSDALLNALYVFQVIIDDWRIEKDYEMVAAFFSDEYYKNVAKKLNKNGSLVWKRKKSLKIDQYYAIKKTLNYLSHV